jgi:hypothetical protein
VLKGFYYGLELIRVATLKRYKLGFPRNIGYAYSISGDQSLSRYEGKVSAYTYHIEVPRTTMNALNCFVWTSSEGPEEASMQVWGRDYGVGQSQTRSAGYC